MSLFYRSKINICKKNINRINSILVYQPFSTYLQQ